MDKTFKLYTLIDPRDNQIFYVGITSVRLSKRLGKHLVSKTNKAKVDIISELKALSLRPLITLIQDNLSLDEASVAEELLIRSLIEQGIVLTNKHKGGISKRQAQGTKHTQETLHIMRINSLGKTHSKEAKEKISKARKESGLATFKNRKHSEETKKKMSASHIEQWAKYKESNINQ